MKCWYRLLSTAQIVILVSSASDRVNIPNTPPPLIHHFLNTRNYTALQAEFFLTYAGHNLYPQSLLYQDLLQGHILPITCTDAPTSISPLLAPPQNHMDWKTRINAQYVSKSFWRWDRTICPNNNRASYLTRGSMLST